MPRINAEFRSWLCGYYQCEKEVPVFIQASGTLCPRLVGCPLSGRAGASATESSWRRRKRVPHPRQSVDVYRYTYFVTVEHWKTVIRRHPPLNRGVRVGVVASLVPGSGSRSPRRST